MNGGDTVNFHAGQNHNAQLTGLTVTKGGTGNAKLVFRRYSTGANPIINGMYTVPSWTQRGTSNVYTARIPGGINVTGVVLLDGVPVEMVKLPRGNQGYYNVTSFSGTNPVTITGTNANNGSLNYQTSTPPNITAAVTGWAGEIAWRAQHWVIWRGNVTGQTLTTITATPFAGGLDGAGNVQLPQTNYGFFLQNHPALCSQLGDWAYNVTNDSLAMFFPSGPAGHTVQITQVQTLVNVNGSNVSFSNIVLRGAATNIFSVVGFSNVVVQNCRLQYSGFNGAFISGTGTGNQLQSDTIEWCSSRGVRLSGGQTAGIINHCVVTYSGNWAGMGGSGEGQYVGILGINGGWTLTSDSVRASGYNGISFNLVGGGTANPNNLVRFCFVDSFGYVKDDAGGIYWGAQNMSTSKLSRDISINGKGAPVGTPDADQRTFGFYNDDQATNMEIDSCTAAFNGRSGIFNHRGIAINMHHNTLYDNGPSGNQSGGYTMLNDGAGGAANNIYKHNISFAKTAAPTEYVYSSGTAPNTFAAAGLDSNNWCKPINETQAFNSNSTLIALAAWKTASGQDAHSVATPWSITDTSQLKFFYNATPVAKAFTFNGTGLDVFNVSYPGTVTLQPFTSIILKVTGSVPPLTATATAALNPVACFGNVTSATVNVTGGVAPYQYEIGTNGFGSSPTFTGLGAGTYTFTVKDAAGTTTTTTLTITQPTQITITESNPPITINGQLVSITINASNGTPGYTYSLDGVNFQASNVFTNKGAGNYTATVRDSHNCTNTFSFTITQPAALTLGLVVGQNPLLCFGSTTGLTANAGGGTPPYSFKLNNGTPQSSNQFTGLPAGTYQVTVTDAAGASTNQTVTITQPAQIIFNATFPPINVNGQTTTVTLNITSGGVGPFTYTLTGKGSQGTNVFTNVAAGNYTAQVMDANGCVSTINFTITQPTALTLSGVISVPILCAGGQGTISLNATGGTTPYSYRVNNGTPQSSPIFAGLTAANYTFTVTDGGGAIVSTQVNLTQPAQITVGISGNGSAPATIVVAAGGGVAPFTYSLDGGTFQPGNTFSNVTAGNHFATVKDNNGCTVQQNFTVGSSLSISASHGNIACAGGTTTASVVASNGTVPYSYLWSNGQQQATATGLVAGTYTVTVTDGANHVHDTTFTIPQPSPVVISNIAFTPINVNGGNTNVVFTANGGAGGFTYSLDGSPFQGSNTFTGVLAGNHTIIVKDANGCTVQQNFTISQPGPLIIGIARGSAPLCSGNPQTITVSGTGGTLAYTFAVDNGTFSATNVFNSLAGTHIYRLKDAFGAEADTTIIIVAPPALTISVAFTPILVNGNPSTLTVTPGGGTPGYQYQLDGGSFQGSNVFAGVLAGPHTVTIKDANNCTTFQTFSITQPTALSFTATPVLNPLHCYNDVTTTNLVGSGGTTPYTYGINGTFGSNPSFANLHAGTYTFSIKDAFGARVDTIITIGQPSLVTITQVAWTPDITTVNGTTTVTVSAAGGTVASNYTYVLDGGAPQGSGVFANITAGNHTVVVTDDNGCTSGSFVFNIPGVPQPLQIQTKRQNEIRVHKNL